MLGEVTKDGNDGTADRRTGLGGANRAEDEPRIGAAEARTEVESFVYLVNCHPIHRNLSGKTAPLRELREREVVVVLTGY